MKIKYEFVTGEVVEVEVDEKWGKILEDLDFEEKMNDRKETRRHVSLDTGAEWSGWLITDDDPEGDIIEMIETRRDLTKALSVLSENQIKLVKALFVEGFSQEEYAEKNGVTQVAIARQLDRIRKKLKKLF